jgi:hypothetical protein
MYDKSPQERPIPSSPIVHKHHLEAGEAAVIALFGALWGLMEITLGAALKGMRIPLSGALLSTLAAIIALTGRYFVQRRGAIIMMGGVAALIKIFSAGTVIAGPFFAIILEGLLAEIVILVLGVSLPGFIAAGAAMVCYTVIHLFVSQGILFGGRIYEVYWTTARQIGRFLHLEVEHLTAFIALYLGAHLLAGGLAGWFAFRVAKAAQAELKKLEHSE